MTCPVTFTLSFKVTLSYFDLYLVIQGYSFSLYYTVFCIGILPSTTTLQNSDSNSSSQRSGMTCHMTLPCYSRSVSFLLFVIINFTRGCNAKLMLYILCCKFLCF